MSRPLRLEYPGALWHVTARGNERKPIYRDDADRERFLEVLADTVAWAGWRVQAWVLMGNHYHLLVETHEPTLSAGMRQLNGIYTQAFNRRHRRAGHLFQGRFKGILVERGTHLSEMVRYIVRNPVRAKLCANAAEWRWSSYRATAGLTKAPPWLDVGATLALFDRHSRVRARAAFRRHVTERRGAEYRPWDDLTGQIFLGDEDFMAEQQQRISRRVISTAVPGRQRDPARPALDDIAHAATTACKTRLETLGAGSRLPHRLLFAHLAREHRYGWRVIAERLGTTPMTASLYALAFAEKIMSDTELRRQLKRAETLLR
jgi:putative transposase